MKSVYIRERKLYTKSEMMELFSELDANQLNIFISNLKAYGILKLVKGISKHLELSNLVILDDYLFWESDNQDSSCYIFNYVGIIIVDGYLLCCYPKYLLSHDKIEDKTECRQLLKQVLKVLHRYNTNTQSIQLYCEGLQASSFSRLSLIIALLDDYFQNGIYINTQNVHEFNGVGEINWNRTINFIHPMWQEEEPYYINLWTRKNTIDDKNFIQRIHECLLTHCSRELEELTLLELLDIQGVDLTDLLLEDLGDKEYLLHRISNELNIEFNSRKQYVLKLMSALIMEYSSVSEANNINLFGTNSFNLVWECVCADVFDNKLKVPLSSLPLPQPVKIPNNILDTKPKTLQDLIERPKWISTKNNIAFSDTLIPDLISVEQYGNGYSFVILDAKYYTIRLENNKINGQPGIGDITKQYLYQLAYKDFIELNEIQHVKNCFLMPTEKDDITHIGYAQLEMLNKIGLECIQVREIPAHIMFEYYLQRRKMAISRLHL